MQGDSGAHTRAEPRRDREGARAPLLHIVEDDGSTLALLRDVAQEAGWVTRGFVRLHDFESALLDETPDLVILDDDLPDGRGGDLARSFRTDSRLRHVPLLVCTAAHPMRVAEINAWAPVVAKPFDLAEIEAFLNAVARRRAVEGERAAG